MKSNQHAGDVNMKGRKTKTLRCRCCDCVDFREDVLLKEHKKEMDYWVSGLNQRFAKPSNPLNGSAGSNPA